MTLPSTVFQGNRANSWNTGPRSGPGPVTALPLTATLPLLGATKPPTTYSRVDLPHPEGPRMATNSPSAIESEISPRARWRWPRAGSNDLLRRSMSIMSWAAHDLDLAGLAATIRVAPRCFGGETA